MKFSLLTIAFFLIFQAGMKASDLIDVLPLINQILILHFNDEYAIYHKKGQARAHEKVVIEPLNKAEAVKPVNYLLKSPDDSNYSSGLMPSDIGRKTKGTEFTWICESWNNVCINTSPDHVENHWIYLYLPQPILEGKIYQLQTGSLANNGALWWPLDVKWRL